MEVHQRLLFMNDQLHNLIAMFISGGLPMVATASWCWQADRITPLLANTTVSAQFITSLRLFVPLNTPLFALSLPLPPPSASRFPLPPRSSSHTP